MGWPNNYVQGVYDATGNLSGVENITGGINGLAAKLGFVAGADNTQAFINYNTYLNTTNRQDQLPVYLDSGDYYADEWIIAASSGGEIPAPRLIGKGRHQTYIKPNVTSKKIFIQMARGLVHTLVLDGITILGSTDVSGDTPVNVGQIGVALIANYDTAKNSGGIVEGAIFRNFSVFGFSREQFVLKGGSPNTGTGSFLQPHQFIQFDGRCSFSREAGNHRPALSLIGQIGQTVNSGNLGVHSGNRVNNGGPALWVGQEHYFNCPTPASIAANEFTVSGSMQLKLATEVRPVAPTGSVLPAELTAGTSYFIIDSADYKFKLATSAANAIANTAMTIATVGTTGWRLVGLWATAVDTTTDTVTFNIPPLSCDGDAMIAYGVNLPAGMTSGTVMYYRPTDEISGQFYTSLAFAQAGGATGRIDLTTTGTLTTFGFRHFGGGGGATNTPSGVDLGELSMSSTDIAVAALAPPGNSIGEIEFKPYFEQCQIGVFAHGSIKVKQNGGNLLNAAWGSGGVRASGFLGKALERAIIEVNGIPVLGGTRDDGFSIETVTGNNSCTLIYPHLDKLRQFISFANASTAGQLSCLNGLDMTIGYITAALALATPTKASPGFKLTLNMRQNGTGGFTVTAPASFKGVAIGSGTANQWYRGSWVYDGSQWMQESTTGWLT